MFTEYTYQDWLAARDRSALLLDAVRRYKASKDFLRALEANAYFTGSNTAVSRKTVLRARKIETRDEHGRRRVRSGTRDVVGNRIASGFLARFVTQQTQFLLGSGVTLGDRATKERLGLDFDHQLARMGERALLHGACYGYWNVDHLEVLEAACDSLSGFFPLMDEMTGALRLGVQFWQLSPRRPLYLRVFEEDGVTVFRAEKSCLIPEQPKRAYVVTMRSDALGDEILSAECYPVLPVIALYANAERQSELTPSIKSKIDAYDNILSDFADNLDRANDVYWVLNNFGGTSDDVAQMLEEISRIKAVANLSDGTGASATAEPHTIEVPYEARCAALRLLEKALYADYMALDFSELTGGSLTNVAIRTATANLNLKANRFEWELFRFMRDLLRLIGVDTDHIHFQRQEIGNISETIADICAMRADIDRRTALKLNPYIQEDEIAALL